MFNFSMAAKACKKTYHGCERDAERSKDKEGESHCFVSKRAKREGEKRARVRVLPFSFFLKFWVFGVGEKRAEVKDDSWERGNQKAKKQKSQAKEKHRELRKTAPCAASLLFRRLETHEKAAGADRAYLVRSDLDPSFAGGDDENEGERGGGIPRGV